jgi:hypothetical protein
MHDFGLQFTAIDEARQRLNTKGAFEGRLRNRFDDNRGQLTATCYPTDRLLVLIQQVWDLSRIGFRLYMATISRSSPQAYHPDTVLAQNLWAAIGNLLERVEQAAVENGVLNSEDRMVSDPGYDPNEFLGDLPEGFGG